MAKKSAEEMKAEGVKLKAMFAKVKKKQHNFAMLIAKDGLVIETHVKKSANILLKTAKKNGGTAKGAWGVMTMSGQTIELAPENDKVPGSLPKLAKKFFSERGINFKVSVKEAGEGDEDKEKIEAIRKDLAKELKKKGRDFKKALVSDDKTGVRDLSKMIKRFMSDLKDKKADLDKMEELEENFKEIEEKAESMTEE